MIRRDSGNTFSRCSEIPFARWCWKFRRKTSISGFSTLGAKSSILWDCCRSFRSLVNRDRTSPPETLAVDREICANHYYSTATLFYSKISKFETTAVAIIQNPKVRNPKDYRWWISDGRMENYGSVQNDSVHLNLVNPLNRFWYQTWIQKHHIGI